MLYIYEYLLIILAHWVFDFILQTDKEATGKSHDNMCLVSHTIKYSMPWSIVTMLMFLMRSVHFFEAITLGCTFTMITFITHTVTDYFTSRYNSKLWAENKRHMFFVAIGGDQVLHYFQLILTYYLLTLF